MQSLHQPHTRQLRAHCPYCQIALSLPAHLAGTSGPCPQCGNWLDAALFSASESKPTAPLSAAPARQLPQRQRAGKKAPSSSRGRLAADSFIDYKHLERRELFRTLQLFLWIVITCGLLLAVAFYLEDTMKM